MNGVGPLQERIEQVLQDHAWINTQSCCGCNWGYGDLSNDLDHAAHVAAAVVQVLVDGGAALVDRATLEQLRDCYGDEFTDGLTGRGVQ